MKLVVLGSISDDLDFQERTELIWRREHGNDVDEASDNDASEVLARLSGVASDLRDSK